MQFANIPWQRLAQQRLIGAPFADPAQVVGWLGAVQAQEYALSKWSLALRCGASEDAAIERALAEGRILRTHVLRPTWHFVTPADIRWMLALTGPRVKKLLSTYDRRLGVDAAALTRAHAVMARVLEGGNALPRAALRAELEREGINTEGTQRYAHLLMHAELDGLICSGPREGNQHTYALLEERATPAPPMSRDESLAELVRRYFTSHGPATLKDFAWWSGLTVADTRAGLEMLGNQVTREELDGKTYWVVDAPPFERPFDPVLRLLGPYDEFLIAFTDRSASLDPAVVSAFEMQDGPMWFNALIVDGQYIGAWRRAIRGKEVVVETRLARPLTPEEQVALQKEVARYGAYLGLTARLS